MSNTMEEIKQRRCDCHTPARKCTRYWKAITNGCLQCMKKYEIHLYFTNDHWALTWCMIHQARCMSEACEPPVNITNDREIHILAFRYHVNKLISSRHPDLTIDILTLLKSHMCYSVNKLNILKFPILTTVQLTKLLQIGFLPDQRFWEPYVKKKLFSSIIKIKQLLISHEFPMNKQKAQKAIRVLEHIIQSYISTKVNLYIMKRVNLLCPDTAKYIERFIY